jgi:NMD protein affecting ribosome stability and mRNA decay
MAWECAYCGDKEGAKKRLPVCHHCGRPVCARHREMISDDAFDSGVPTSRIAVHCRECREQHHPRTASVEPEDNESAEATG